MGIAVLALILLIILLLWKRGFVLYSLKSGEIALSYVDKEHAVQLEVILLQEGNELSLGKSGVVRINRRLRRIKKAEGAPIAPVEVGKYKGRLLITAEGYEKTKDCRIKVLDKELKK